jgi:formate dehydrogenase assembly factor FdhD
VALADSGGITLVGFLRERRFNVYAHPERLEPPAR